MIGKYAVKTSPIRRMLGVAIVILFGILLSRYVSVQVEKDICRDSGGTWNAAAKKCDKAAVKSPQ
jgi:hypothetical protein